MTEVQLTLTDIFRTFPDKNEFLVEWFRDTEEKVNRLINQFGLFYDDNAELNFKRLYLVDELFLKLKIIKCICLDRHRKLCDKRKIYDEKWVATGEKLEELGERVFWGNNHRFPKRLDNQVISYSEEIIALWDMLDDMQNKYDSLTYDICEIEYALGFIKSWMDDLTTILNDETG